MPLRGHALELLQPRDEILELLARADPDLEPGTVARRLDPSDHAEPAEAGVGRGRGQVVVEPQIGRAHV